jgi:hypothetical protein
MRAALRAAEIEAATELRDFAEARFQNLHALADRIAARHWHVNDLPWADLPPLPIPREADTRRTRAVVAFGKRAIQAQLAAEHVAVSAAHRLLCHAETAGLHPSVGRALAALLNDEASHVAVMLELSVRADAAFPDVVVQPIASPLFDTFVTSLPHLHPAPIAIAMGLYEAAVAIRSYTAEAAYRHPSILGRIAELAAQDDALHARVLRLVSHVLVDELRQAEVDDAARLAAIRTRVVEPLIQLWPLLCDHERLLLGDDQRYAAELRRRLAIDAVIMRRLLTSLGIDAPDLRGTSVTRG